MNNIETEKTRQRLIEQINETIVYLATKRELDDNVKRASIIEKLSNAYYLLKGGDE